MHCVAQPRNEIAAIGKPCQRVFAEVISAIACWRMNMEMQLHLEIWLILPLVMTVLCAVIGRYRLSYLSDIPPLQSLRELNS